MTPFLLRICRTSIEPLFCFGLLLWLLPLNLLAQFCTNAVTVAGGDNQLNSPYNIVVDGEGNVFVSEVFGQRIMKFAPGSTQGVIFAGGNGEGSDLNQLHDAADILLDGNGNLLVADYGNNRVLKFPPNSTSATSGTIVAGGNGAGEAPTKLYNPSTLALDDAGNLYVANLGGNYRIKKFPPNSTSSSEGITVIGGTGYGSALNQFNDSFGIVVDENGYIYVGDTNNNRVLKFPPNSNSATSGTIVAGGNGAGDNPNQFDSPQDIVLHQGTLYVTDLFNNRVQAFSPNSTSLTEGTTVIDGDAALQLDGPTGLIIDTDGNLFVADMYKGRVQRFSSSSPFYFIGQQPTNQTACAGATVTATVSLSGTVIGYQWYKDNVSLGNAQQQAILSLSNVQASDAGSYYVIVTGCTSLTSTPFTLDVITPPTPVLSLPPTISLPIFQNTLFLTLTVSGCSGGTVTWQGPNGASGSSTLISVPTSATGTLVYSATCTVGSCTSPPGSATVTISPPEATGSFDGFVYGADCATFRGWAWDRNKINTALSIDILDGPIRIATLMADVFRQDLQSAGKGNGKHAFSFPIPADLKDGKPHYLSARVSASSFFLKDAPKVLVCEGVPVPGGNKAPVPPTPTVLVAPLAAQVGVPFSGTLVPFTDPEGQPLTYKLTGLPGGLAINETTRVISGTPTEAGTFVLAYQATDPGPLTNSVSFALTVNPQSTTSVTGSFEGYLDKVECGTIRGWVWDRNKPNTPVTVEFYSGGTVWGSVVANIYRDDLKNAGKGNGSHGYSFTVPPALKDNTTQLMYGRVQGSTYVLKDSGKPLTCPSPVRLSAESSEGLQVTVMGNPVSDQLQVEVRGAEGQLLHIQLSDASGRLVSQRQIETAKAVEQQTLSVGQQPAGLLLLRVQSGLHRLTLKVLKQ
jgi:sugar lactone lactonase YvrE